MGLNLTGHVGQELLLFIQQFFKVQMQFDHRRVIFVDLGILDVDLDFLDVDFDLVTSLVICLLNHD